MINSAHYIETVTGKLVNPSDPQKETIELHDIAWALSRIPRFAGHTVTETVYNVAQHSICVAEMVAQLFEENHDIPSTPEVDLCIDILRNKNINKTFLKALLHDAHEAYIGDLPSPLKQIPALRTVIKDLEAKLDGAIFDKFCLEAMSEEEGIIIKHCDKLAQAIEGFQFMPSRGKNWNLPKPSLTLLQNFRSPQSPSKSYQQFIQYFQYLSSNF